MPSIILKKSSVAARVPVAGDLAYGELALNYADGKLYYKKSDGTTIDYFKAGLETDTLATVTGRGASSPSQITLSGAGDNTTTYSSLRFAGYNQGGGTGYHGVFEIQNTYASATNSKKFFRISSDGQLQIINSAYTTNIFNLTDAGALTVQQLIAGGSAGTLGQVLTSTGTGMSWSSAGGGTVTSVAGAGTVSGLTLTGTVTSSGSLTLGGTLAVTPSNFASQTANTVLAAPNGAAGTPTFRTLVAADIPTLNQNTTGSANRIAFLDTRSTNDLPNARPAYSLTADFKLNASVDNPPVTSDNGYSHIISVSGWDSGGSGGWVSQLSVANGIAVRKATSGTVWGAWKTMLDSSNYSSYALPLSGGTLTGNVSTSGTVTATNGFIGRLYGAAAGAPDSWIWSVSPANPTWGMYYNEGTPDAIEFRAADAVKASIFLDTGAATFASTVTAPTFSGALSGNSTTATTLQTARTINGVSFNGSADITVADSTKLPLAGGTMTGALKLPSAGYMTGDNSFEKLLSVSFANGTANLAADIRLGNLSFWGYIEVEITSTFANQNAAGKLTKLFAVGTNVNNNIYNNVSRVSDVMGSISASIAIGEFAWDATNSTYRIPISHIGSLGNDYTIKVRMFTHGAGASAVFPGLAMSASYTLTSLAAHTAVTYNGNLLINGTSQVLHAGNYNSYAIPLTGGIVSGTLSIGTGSGLSQDFIKIGSGASVGSTDYHSISNYNGNELFVQPHTYFRVLRGYAYTTSSRKQTVADSAILVDNNNIFLAYDKGNVNIGYTSDQTYKLAVNGTGLFSGDLTVSGNLTVNGTTTTINSTTLSVDDKNIELGSIATPTDTTADGGGITLKGATDKTFNWLSATNSWTSNVTLAAPAIALSVSNTNKILKQALTPTNISVNTIATIDTWATATYRSAKYTIQVTQGTKYQISEVNMIHDGTNVIMNEYSVLETNAAASIPVTFSAAIATGTLTLSATVTNAATTNASIIIERTLFVV